MKSRDSAQVFEGKRRGNQRVVVEIGEGAAAGLWACGRKWERSGAAVPFSEKEGRRLEVGEETDPWGPPVSVRGRRGE
jgi:hypothetical protein